MRRISPIASALLAIALATSGCMVRRVDEWRVLTIGPNTPLHLRIAEGDKLRVTTVADKVYRFTVAQVQEDSFEGWGENRKKYRIPRASIRKLERNESYRVEELILYPNLPR